MAQKEFKKANFAKLFNCNVFFGDYLQYISWAVKNSKTVDTLIAMQQVYKESGHGRGFPVVWRRATTLDSRSAYHPITE